MQEYSEFFLESQKIKRVAWGAADSVVILDVPAANFPFETRALLRGASFVIQDHKEAIK
jgi:hypothetical protein